VEGGCRPGVLGSRVRMPYCLCAKMVAMRDWVRAYRRSSRTLATLRFCRITVVSLHVLEFTMIVRLGADEGQGSARALAISSFVVDMVAPARPIGMQMNFTPPYRFCSACRRGMYPSVFS
jgi:hypothetical protein